MENPFVQSIASNFDRALRLMEVALVDCPDDLWETDLWPDEAPTAPTPQGGLHGSAPWFLGYHALLTLDYDLTAEFEPWEPPEPFDENTYAFPNRRFTKAELLGYIGYSRERVRRTLDALTEEAAARPLPALIDTKGFGTESLSAACPCTFSSTPARSASSSLPRESKCNLCPAIVATAVIPASDALGGTRAPRAECAPIGYVEAAPINGCSGDQ